MQETDKVELLLLTRSGLAARVAVLSIRTFDLKALLSHTLDLIIAEIICILYYH